MLAQRWANNLSPSNFLPTHVDVGQTLALHRSSNVEGCEVLTIYFALVNTLFYPFVYDLESELFCYNYLE